MRMVRVIVEARLSIDKESSDRDSADESHGPIQNGEGQPAPASRRMRGRILSWLVGVSPVLVGAIANWVVGVMSGGS